MNSKTYKPIHGGYPTYRRGAMWFNPRDWRKASSYKLGDLDVIEELRVVGPPFVRYFKPKINDDSENHKRSDEYFDCIRNGVAKLRHEHQRGCEQRRGGGDE